MKPTNIKRLEPVDKEKEDEDIGMIGIVGANTIKFYSEDVPEDAYEDLEEN